MIIRTAQISDIKAILPLMEQLEYPQDSETMSIILRNYLNMKFHKIFVAEIDSRVSGLISIAGVCSLVYDAMIYRITSLIVDKNHRRKSIGQQLMMEAEKFAKNNDYNRNNKISLVYSHVLYVEVCFCPFCGESLDKIGKIYSDCFKSDMVDMIYVEFS